MFLSMSRHVCKIQIPSVRAAKSPQNVSLPFIIVLHIYNMPHAGPQPVSAILLFLPRSSFVFALSFYINTILSKSCKSTLLDTTTLAAPLMSITALSSLVFPCMPSIGLHHTQGRTKR